MAGLKFAFVVLMCMAVMGAPIAQAITCGQVAQNLLPCLGYLQNGQGPSPSCCGGVKKVLAAATTTADRQAICNCLKSTAAQMGGRLNPKNAESLPTKCGLNIPYKFSTSTNCASIRF